MQNPELIIKSVEKLRQVAEQEEKSKTDYLEKNFNSLANELDIPWQGNKDAKVVLVEFIDYNCGYCKKSMEAIKIGRAHVLTLVTGESRMPSSA